MAENLPEPLTPADCDLREFSWTKLDIVRLFSSDTWLLGTADEKVASITLWCKSWHQVPAGSLPDNDRVLAHLSDAGPSWRKVREHALRNWVKCSDGRLYHPVVCEKARESWQHKLAQMSRTEAARQAKAARKAAPQTHPTETVTTSVKDAATGTVTTSVTERVTGSRGEGEEKEKESKQQLPFSNPREAVPRIGESPERWMHLGEKAGLDDDGTRHPMVNGYFLDIVAEALCQAAKINTATWRGDWRPLIAWLKADIPSDLIIETVRQIAARPGYKPPASLAYFDKPIRERAGLECAA